MANMNQNLSSATLRSLLSLTEKRESLLSEVEKIESQISAVLGGGITNPVAVTASSKPRKAFRTGKRGAMKEIILSALKEAGEAGIQVKDLAAKIGAKPQNVHVWIHTTGKKSGLVRAVGKGIYRLEEALGVTTPTAELEAPTPKVTAKKVGRPRGKRNTKARK